MKWQHTVQQVWTYQVFHSIFKMLGSPTHLTLRARLFTCSWLGSLSSSPLRTKIVLFLRSVSSSNLISTCINFCLLSCPHISISYMYISTYCCWRSLRQGPDHPRPPPAGNICPDSPGGRESEDDEKVKVRAAEKVKVAEKVMDKVNIHLSSMWLVSVHIGQKPWHEMKDQELEVEVIRKGMSLQMNWRSDKPW